MRAKSGALCWYLGSENLQKRFQQPFNKHARWCHCVNNFELHRTYITVLCYMLELYELIQDLREFLIYFPNLTIFKVPP